MLEAVGGAVCAAGLMAWGVRGRSSTLFGPSVYHGDRARRAIALTFDDGPSESTPELLELLAAHRARATFFQCGLHAARLPEVARGVVQAGHEIGNHTYSHARLWLRSPAFIESEIARGQEAIERAAGARPRLFRPPYGVRWFGLRRAQRRFGLLGVMWTAIGLEWKLPARRVAENLIGSAANGAILCLHDGREAAPRPDIRQTLEAVRRLLPALAERGYHFETVSEILCPTT